MNSYVPFLSRIGLMWKLALSLAVLLAAQASANAQLFGSRSIGGPIQGRSGVPSQTGRIQGNERFLRENRGRAEFVGADQRDTRSFVGSEQGRTSGRIMSATAGLRAPDKTQQRNRPLGYPDSDEMYHPRLTVAATVPPTAATVAHRFQQELTRSDYFSSRCRFEVSVVDRQVSLQGEVTSAREADLAELLALFEPGISSVRNNLRVLAPADLLPGNSVTRERPEAVDQLK
jgi:hypothetical protein